MLARKGEGRLREPFPPAIVILRQAAPSRRRPEDLAAPKAVCSGALAAVGVRDRVALSRAAGFRVSEPLRVSPPGMTKAGGDAVRGRGPIPTLQFQPPRAFPAFSSARLRGALDSPACPHALLSSRVTIT